MKYNGNNNMVIDIEINVKTYNFQRKNCTHFHFSNHGKDSKLNYNKRSVSESGIGSFSFYSRI